MADSLMSDGATPVRASPYGQPALQNPDLSSMSDADLQKIADQSSTSTASPPDLSRVSDGELRRIASQPANILGKPGGIGGGPALPFVLPSDMAEGGPQSGGLGSGPAAPFILPSDQPAQSPTFGTGEDIARSAGQGLLSGAEGLIGLPGDIKRAADWAASKALYPVEYGMAWAEGYARQKAGALDPGETPSSFATKRVAQAHELIASRNALPSTSDVIAAGKSAGLPDYQPQTTAGQYARTLGEFVPGALTMPAEGLADVGANLAKYALIGGTTSETAGQLTAGTNAEPYARAAGAILGGVGSDLTVAGTRQAWRAGKSFVEPMTTKGQQAIAARKLAGQFTDPEMARAVLQESADAARPGQAIGENVPGSKPTTGQYTGDMGALSLERELATRQPELAKSNPFGTGSEQQNAARTLALNAIQPTGSPEEVGNLVRQRMAAITADEDAKVAAATQAAQKAGSSASDAVQGQAKAVDAAQTAGVNAARLSAQQAAVGIGSGATPEAQGEALRTALQSARDAAKTRERSLWQAVDPDGTLALPGTPISGAATSIAKSVPTTAKPMEGEERAIFNTAGSLPPVSMFSDIAALRSRISTAMRQELIANGQSPTYGRLSQLRGSIEDAISDAATHKAAQDASAVSRGDLHPGETIGARFERGTSEVQGVPVSGIPAGEVPAEARAASAPGGNQESGTNSAGNPGFRNDAGGQGVPGYVPRSDGQVLGAGKVYYPNGALDVNYELANLPSLITSHDTNFRVNKGYPADLQPRAREQAPAQDQVNGMSSRLQPERLGRSPEANSGAPIVGPDNVVESGNGRTLALSKAYSAGRGGDYRQWLASQGIDTTGLSHPILVARRTSALSPEQRIAFAHSANTASGLAMTDGEKAFADARLISPASLDHLSDTGLTSAENQPFVRSFLAQLPATERADLLDAQGALSQKGLRRLELAMMAKAYGDGDFIDKAFVARDLNVRGIAGGLTDAAPAWAKMRDAAREGAIDAGHDVTPALMTAARGIVRAREAGRPIAEVLNQGDLFGDEASAQAKGFLVNGKGQLASRAQIADRLRAYANEAQKNLAAPGLFGDTVTPSQVMRTTLSKLGDAGAEAAGEPELASAAMKTGPMVNMDEAAAARLRAATNATRERAQTFDQGPVGAVLKKAGSANDYKTWDAAVPGKLFVKGPTGAQAVQGYINAAGNTGALETAAAESLRRTALTPEGHIDPTRFARWRFEHQDALRALPQSLRDRFQTAASATDRLNELTTAREMAVEPLQGAAESLSREVMTPDGVLDPRKFERWQTRHRDVIDQLPANIKTQLSTAAKASEAIGQAADARKQAIDAYQQSAAGKFLGVTHPEDVSRTVSRIFGTKTAARNMSDLAKRVASNPDAKEGLRKAVADAILAKAKGTTENGASGVENLNASTFQKFLRDNAHTIKAAGFSDRELGSMQAVAQDLQRSQRTLQATRLAGQSNTAQDIMASLTKIEEGAKSGGHPLSLLGKIAAPAYLLHEHGAPLWAVAGGALSVCPETY